MRISSRKKYQIPLSTDHTNYESYPGNRVPSVTTVLKIIGKESLMQWANSLGWKRKSLNKELNDASVIGTLAHNYIESFIFDRRSERYNINVEIDSLPYEMNEKTRNAINSFLIWWRDHGDEIDPIDTEVQLVCDFYGGTLDLLCRYRGKLTIIDFKTSSDFHPTMYMQLAAYAKMYEAQFGERIEQVAVLRLDKKRGTKATLKTIDEVPGGDIDFYYNAFMAATGLYRFMNVIDHDWE